MCYKCNDICDVNYTKIKKQIFCDKCIKQILKKCYECGENFNKFKREDKRSLYTKTPRGKKILCDNCYYQEYNWCNGGGCSLRDILNNMFKQDTKYDNDYICMICYEKEIQKLITRFNEIKYDYDIINHKNWFEILNIEKMFENDDRLKEFLDFRNRFYKYVDSFYENGKLLF